MAKTISIVEYIHELKEAGFTDKQAEVQAKRMEQIVAEVKAEVKEDLKQQDLAKKIDVENTANLLRKEIVEAKNQVILWVIGIVAANSVFFLGILAKGFHWW